MSILDRFMSLFDRAPGDGRNVVDTSGDDIIGELSLYDQYTRVGGSLTPTQVSQILRRADNGCPRGLVDLANDARQKDGHMQAVLRDAEQAVALLDYQISPFKERDEKEPNEIDSEIAAFCEDAVQNAPGEGQRIRPFQDLIDHMQGGPFHGFAVSQTVWHKRSDGMIVPLGWVLNDQRRFGFRMSDGRLVWDDSQTFGFAATGAQGVDLHENYPGSFIIHQPRVNGDVPAREGLSRLLVWWALIRSWDTAAWLKLAQIAWQPLRKAQYGRSITPEDKSTLKRALQRLVTSGAMIYPEGVTVEIDWPNNSPTGGKSNHAELHEVAGREMSKAVQHGTLTTEAGDKGARSLGEVHADGKLGVREIRARQTNATLRRDLFPWLVWLNYGGAARLPHTGFDTGETEDLANFGRFLASAKAAKLPILVDWAHDKIGHPPVGPDDQVIGDDQDEPNDDDDGSSESDDSGSSGSDDDPADDEAGGDGGDE